MYKIILSLTAHENLECLWDLLDNIKKCFVNYNILILLSITENLCHEQLKKYDFVKVVTVRPRNFSIWGTIHLFHQHILNMEYIYNNSITYDFFWFVASNEMFFKIIPSDFLDNYSLKIINKKAQMNELDYKIYYKKLVNEAQPFGWFNLAKKDSNFMNYLYKNKFTIECCAHEGMVLSSDIILEIFNEYNANKLYDNSTFKNYVMEEIFIPSYLINKYTDHLNTFCFRYIYYPNLSKNSSYKEIENNAQDYHVSIKPVVRDYNSSMRKYIRNKIISLHS